VDIVKNMFLRGFGDWLCIVFRGGNRISNFMEGVLVVDFVVVVVVLVFPPAVLLVKIARDIQTDHKFKLGIFQASQPKNQKTH